jgi:hypothetical protein
MTIRSVGRGVWRVLISRAFMVGGIAFIGLSAVLGNFAQFIDRGRAEHDKAELTGQVREARDVSALARAETADVKKELADSTGESKCRAQIAADAEVLSGQVLVGLSQFVLGIGQVTSDPANRDLTSLVEARRLLAKNTPLLTAALEARRTSVDTCAAATTTTSGATP